MRAAASPCPAWGFRAKRRGSKWARLLPRAATARDVRRVARRRRCSARSHARPARPVITAVPFIRARPSLGASASGSSPTAAMASDAGTTLPRKRTGRSPARAPAT